MNEDIRTLMEALRRGQYDDPTEKIALLAAALREQKATLADLLPLLRAPQVPLRLAGLEASRGVDDAQLVKEFLRLTADSDFRVRLCMADLVAEKAVPQNEALCKVLLRDSDPPVRVRACKAVAGQDSFRERLCELASNDPNWDVRREAILALGDVRDLTHAILLLKLVAEEKDDDVRDQSATALEKLIAGVEPEWLSSGKIEGLLLIQSVGRLREHGSEARYPRFAAWLKRRTEGVVDVAGLATYGTDLTIQHELGTLPRTFEFGGPLAMLLERFRREPARPVALIGPSGSGKTALVYALVQALASPELGGWRVLRMAAADFIAGTKYIGEWETRVRDLVAAIRHPRRVLLYIPNLADLTGVGRWAKSDANVAGALAPHLEDGSVRLLGESTPEEFERGLGKEPTLARLFDRVLMEPAGLDTTRRIVRALRDQSGLSASDGVLDELVDASGYYLSHLAQPGGAAGLMRGVIEGQRGRTEALQRRDILATLSQSTGVPVDLLDDAVPLDLPELKTFFESRIIGQPEAVQAVVDLVTLVKAGVTDPHKPFGVMLFVGPTGVGKTELARVLAEYIFGDAGRLVRFDMSEFASPEGYTRLIGGRGENGLLTDAVRQRPFSVILLDEIEKSHLNVFDLCLQIFDAGRLTDGLGRLVDFRRSIVILTSNVGAEAPGGQVGFGGHSGPGGFAGGGAEPGRASDSDRMFRELSRFFRPEFLNRLDRIVQFQPLSMDVAERIARRELDLVLQRSGVARRNLTVSVSPEVMALLVREGYSPHFGARPLKRTVERLVLLPLGRALATGRLGGGDLVTLQARDGRVDVSVAARATGSEEETPGRPAESRTSESIAELVSRVEALKSALVAVSERKSELVGRTQHPGFFGDAVLRESTFDELHKVDAFLARSERCCAAILGLAASVRAGSPRVASRWEELEGELQSLEFIATCRDGRALGDALVILRWVRGKGDAIDAVPTLGRMYRAAAERRNLSAQTVAELFGEADDIAYLHVTGLGAFAWMSGEAGLHAFRRRSKVRAYRGATETDQEDLAVVFVEVCELSGAPDRKFVSRLTTRIQALKPTVSRLVEEGAWRIEMFDGDTVRSLAGIFPGTRKAALESAAGLIWTLATEAGHRSSDAKGGEVSVIREYELGQGACIRDLRTGRSTTRVSHVFRGQLELLAAR